MISIAKVNNAKYHLEHSQFDYYSEQENEKGEFRGALMKWQKLEGKEVDEKNYMKQIEHGGEDNKGVDLCFSPPKDWTLLYNMADDETRLKMDAIRDKAVDKIVKGIEQNTYYRETVNGETKFVLARGVGMATFNHHTSREVQDDHIHQTKTPLTMNEDGSLNKDSYVDPQEHTHITVFPKVLGQDGKFHSHTLLDLKYEKGNNHEGLRYLDQLGQHELCKGLKELGFNVYEIDKHGNFGIEGIDDNLRDEFSGRKKQIENAVGEDATYNEKKEVALKFRATKSDHDLASLRNVWKDKMNELGFNQDKINEMRKPENHTIKHEDKKLADLIDKDKPLSNKKLKTLALSESKFTDKSYDDKLKEFKDDKKVRPISNKYNLYADNKAKEKLADKVNEKSKQPKNNIKDNNQNQIKPIEPIVNKNQNNLGQNNSGKFTPVIPNISSSGSGSGGSNGGSKQELYSEIDSLQLQMLAFPPVAERTPEQHRQVAQIEAQIGQLKEQVKKMEEQEKQIKSGSSSGSGGSGGSGGGSNNKSQKQPKEIKKIEEEEEELLNKKADKMNDILKNEDKMKDSSSSSKLSGIQKDFNNEHKTMINSFTQNQAQQQQIAITR